MAWGIGIDLRREECRTSAPIHPPHHPAGYAPVHPFCTTGHAQRSSWLHSHHRQQAFPAVNGNTAVPSTIVPCKKLGMYPSDHGIYPGTIGIKLDL